MTTILTLSSCAQTEFTEDAVGVSMLPNETRAALQVYIDSSLADRSRTSEPPLAEPNWVSFEKVRYYASIPPKRISIKWAVFRPADKTWYFVRNDVPGIGPFPEGITGCAYVSRQNGSTRWLHVTSRRTAHSQRSGRSSMKATFVLGCY